MSQFTTPAILELLETEQWILREPFEYHVGVYPSEDVIRVPDGFKTDLASIPRLFWFLLPPHGKYAKAAIVHDWLYANGINNKRYADNVFLEAMSVLGVATWKKYTIYYAVRLFGKGNY